MDKQYNPFYDVESNKEKIEQAKKKESNDANKQEYNPFYDEKNDRKDNVVRENYYQSSTIERDKQYNPFYDVEPNKVKIEQEKKKENVIKNKYNDQEYNPFYDDNYDRRDSFVTENYYQSAAIIAKPQTYSYVPFFMLIAVFLGTIIPVFSIPFAILAVCFGKKSNNKLYFVCGIICLIFVIVMVCNWAYIVVTTPVENINN